MVAILHDGADNSVIFTRNNVLGLTRYEAVNGEHYIDLTTTHELQRGDYVRVLSDVDDTWREFMVWNVQEPHDKDLIARTYRCVWSLQGILSTVTSSTMPGTSGAKATATQALTSLLQDTTAIQIGTVEPTKLGSASFWRMTAWEGLGELVEEWGGEVDYSYSPDTGARTINLLDHIGREGAFTFYYGSSRINKITRSMKDGANVSRIIPLGAANQADSGGYGRKIDITSVNGGLPYLEDAEEAAKYVGTANPYPTAYIENSEITDPAELKAWAQTILTTITRPWPEYSVELTEVYKPVAEYVPALGDEGAVIDHDLGAEVVVRVQSIQVDELRGSVKATCSTSGASIGELAKLLQGQGLNATTGGTGTTSASVLFTTEETPYTSAITAYDRGVGGQNVFWRTGGNLVIGAGEYADTMLENDTGQCFSGTGENLWLGADGNVNIQGAKVLIGGRDYSPIGTVKTVAMQSTSVANSTNKSVRSISLEAGTWIVFAQFSFASNATGRRNGKLSAVSGDTSSSMRNSTIMAAVNGGATRFNVTDIFSPTATTTYYATVWQNSGAALSVESAMWAIRIK